MTQDAINLAIAGIVPGIIELLMEKRHVGWQDAAELLYNSTLYEAMEDDSTKLWHLSPLALFDMLEEELETGRITNIPKEQS